MLHAHRFSESWSTNDTHHWHAAICEHEDEKKDYREHNWDAGEVTKEPTVDDEGEILYRCQDCGTSKLERLDPIHVHAFDRMSQDEAYRYCSASCIAKESYYYSCVCGEKGSEIFEIGDFAGHVFSTYVSDRNATCTEDGTKTAHCDVCHIETDCVVDQNSAKGHTYEEAWSTSAAYHWHASSCGHIEETLGYGAHRWDEGTVTKAPTADEDGEKVYTCADCRMTRTEIVWVDGHEHTYESVYSYNETDHWFASSCGHASEVKDKTPHRWDAGSVTSPATIYDEGVMRYICGDCQAERLEAIEKLPSFTVVFYDFDNRIIAKSSYALGTSLTDILLPSVDAEQGFAFVGWIGRDDGKSIESVDFAKAEENDTYSFKPSFVSVHSVLFVDHAGNLIDMVSVVDGEMIEPTMLPAIPAREGYVASWSTDILSERITEERILVPIYEVITFRVTFLDAKDGAAIATRVVEYGSFAMIPEYEPYRLSTKLMAFSGWRELETDLPAENVDANKITGVYSDLTLYASYENGITEPVLAVHVQDSTLTLSFCLPDGTALYSVNAALCWTNEKGVAKITSSAIADLSWLEGEYCIADGSLHMAKEDWFTYNNKAQTIDFVWGCGVGHAFSTDKNTVLINFGTQDILNFSEEVVFSVLEGSTVVYGATSGGAEPEKSALKVWIY